jgi:hypothetical protein
VNGVTPGRRTVTVVAIIWAVSLFLIVLGVLFPSVPLLGLLGTIFESFLSLHIVILGVISVLLAGAAWQLGSHRAPLWLRRLPFGGDRRTGSALIAEPRCGRHGRQSWSDHLRITAP